MRVCIVYDSLYPYTIGGAERWYRNLAERLAAGGHEVTFLTRRQWPRGRRPDVRGVDVVAVSPRMALYAGGRRRILPPLLFGVGVLLHLARHRGRYDVVHTCAFPYFSVLAVAAARRRQRFRVFVDWFEVWTPAYWREYLGSLGGRVGWQIQRACLRVPQNAFCFSRLHEERLRELGFRGRIVRIEGLYEGGQAASEPRPARDLVVFAGRHIPEKRVPALIPAIASARRELPDLRGELYGDGPERPEVLAAIEELGLDGIVTAPGFVDPDVLEEARTAALCLVLPSRREGYGLVVVESSARGVPSVVVADPDNAATELVDDGENGFVAASAEPEDLADAIVRVHRAGPELRASTLEWFRRNAERLSVGRSFQLVEREYESAAS